jgi:tetratricopeptide (TPR) repeat protein
LSLSRQQFTRSFCGVRMRGQLSRYILSVSMLLLVGVRPERAWAGGPTPPPAGTSDADPSQSDKREEARVRYARGIELYSEGEYPLALIELERAYSIAPTFRMLYNIAQVHQQLGHYTKAVAALERYLVDGGDRIEAARRTEVDRDLATLRARTALLTVRTTPVDAEVLLDGTTFAQAGPGERVRVDAGEHTLVVSKPGFTAKTLRVTLAGTDQKTIAFDLLRDATRSPVAQQGATGGAAASAGPWPAIAWTATGVFSVAAVTTGILALGARSDLADQRDTLGSTAQERDQTRSRAMTFATATDIFAGVAILSAAAAVYFTFLSPKKSSATGALAPGGRIHF